MTTLSTTSFNEEQLSLITQQGYPLSLLMDTFNIWQSGETVNVKDLTLFAKMANALYRSGMPIITDYQYDEIIGLLLMTDSDCAHEAYAFEVEPEVEGFFGGDVVELSQRMLSTEKAYDVSAIAAWMKRVEKAAQDTGIAFSDLTIRATPKLDGYAALDDGKVLATRGDGYRGTDISRVFDRGLSVAADGDRGLGPGEIVIDKEYFDAYLSTQFDNTRNVQASIIKEGDLTPEIAKAVADKAVVFFPFSLLPSWQGNPADLMADFESVIESLWDAVPYDIDGVVIEAPALRDVMGHTSHHYRNTIAFKRNDAPVDVKVLSVTFQTGKTGRITPVAELEPTKISGAILSRATLHNIGWAEQRHIGEDSVVEVVRSGLVIPKVVGVKVRGKLNLPKSCSCCGTDLRREGDNLWCDNTASCSAQVGSMLEYFFKTLGNCDGFGPRTLDKLIEGGYTTIPAIYEMKQTDFMALGFGEKTAENLCLELDRSRQTPVEDWRFLAAFSLINVGRGGAEKMLAVHSIDNIFDLTVDELQQIEGFGLKKATLMVGSLLEKRDAIESLLGMGFNLMKTPIGGEQADSAISGKVVVFTGTMLQGARGDMEKQAKALGAKVGKSVTGNTDYLVIGDKVGATKINAAKANGTTILTEDAYLSLIA